ncbi:MAG: DUF362 domain-containing protein [Thermoproteota archaeon]
MYLDKPMKVSFKNTGENDSKAKTRSTVKVSLVKGQDRKANIHKALGLIKEDIKLPEKPILLKPNFVSTSTSLAATHVDAIKAVMDFFLELGAKSFLIGEASSGHTWNGYRNFGYLELEKSYPVKLLDLNEDEWVKTKILDSRFNMVEVKVSKTILDSYRISITRPKTHDYGIVTLALKNMAVGSIIGWDKDLIHQGYRIFNLNLVKLAKLTFPHLSVIDGVVGMEGNGPVHGGAVSSCFTVASANALACDLVTSTLMGFDYKNIGYLWYGTQIGLGPKTLDEIDVIGEKVEDCIMRFHPHRSYEAQLNWKLEQWRELLAKII